MASDLTCVKDEAKYMISFLSFFELGKGEVIKGFAVPLTFEKRIVKYENDTILKVKGKMQ